MLRYSPAIAVGRLVRVAARLRKRGGGSAIPGLVVNMLAPGYLAKALAAFPGGLVVVSGSNGKSTTTKMLVAVLRAHGKSVFTNPSTANIAQGLTSALLEESTLGGQNRHDLAVLEMDEAHGATLAPRLSPSVVVLTNVQVDQIDRFHDAALVTGMLGRIAARASAGVVVNADDANLVAIGAAVDVPVLSYGVSAGVAAAATHGFGYAKAAAERVTASAGIVVEAVSGLSATLSVDGARHDLSLPSRGVHYALDAAAAIGGARVVLADDFDLAAALRAIAELPPVFARGETSTVRGQQVEFLLVKNPASLQLNLDTLDPDGAKLFAYGSDLHDPSFFWTAKVSRLGHVDIATGSKAAELALQLAYDGVSIGLVEPDLIAGIDAFLDQPPPARGHKTIVFSADAMRRTRAYLGLTGDKDES